MKRVLITGKSSYIGNAFAKWLETNRARLPEPMTAELVSLREPEGGKSSQGAPGSWRDLDFSRYDCILHAAGIAHSDISGASGETRREYYRVNTELTAEVAEKALEERVGQFLFLSSIIVYGDPAPIGRSKIITRETKPSPANFYGDSKWQAEQRLSALFQGRCGRILLSGRDVPGGAPASLPAARLCILRLPMVYGPGCKGNYRMLEKLARTVPVFPDIVNERSAIQIESLCRFLYLCVRNGEEGLFFPQDGAYLCTSETVRTLAVQRGRRVHRTRLWNPLLCGISHLADAELPGWVPGLLRRPQERILHRCGGLVVRAFGNMTYDFEISRYRKDYRAPGRGAGRQQGKPL